MKNKYDLNSVEWWEFEIKYLFDIKDWYYNKKPPEEMSKENTIPFLWATQDNNWITGFYSRKTVEEYDKVWLKYNNKDVYKRFFPWNCIAITNNGSVWHAYYQKVEFTCSHDITPVYLKWKVLTRYLANFLILAIERTWKNFEYAKKWRPIRMRKSKIFLPKDSSWNPNWDFMENYMCEKEGQKFQIVLDYYNTKIPQKDIWEIGLRKCEWEEFKISDLFHIKSWKDIQTRNNYWNIPYINSSGVNNWITNYIKEPIKIYKNVLTIARTWTVWATFYQKWKVCVSWNIRVLLPKKSTLNQYIAFFLILCLTKSFKDKFHYWKILWTERLKVNKVLLPVDSEWEPDWNFMERYMQYQEQKLVKQYIKYTEQRIV